MKTRRIILFSFMAIGLVGMFQSCNGSKESEPSNPENQERQSDNQKKSDYDETKLQLMVNELGEPCDCVDQSLSSMTELLAELKVADGVSSQSINDEMNSRLDLCMRPTTDLPNYNKLYRVKLIECDQWTALIQCMGEIQSISSAQATLEAENARAEGLDGAKSAKDVMDKLREQR